MKKLLIISIVFILNIAFAMANISIDVDGESIAMKEFDTGDDNTFLYKAELSTSADPSFYRYKADKLQRGEITFQGQGYNFGEGILIELEVDLNKGYRAHVEYYYVWDETIDMTIASLDGPLEIKFLGESYKIVKVNSDNSFEICNNCNSYSLNVGGSIEVDGKTITLENVGESGSVIINVGGASETVIKGELKTVEGIEILPTQTNYMMDKAERSAVLIIGEDIFLDYKAGDSFNSDWNWDPSSLNEKAATTLTIYEVSGPYIGIKNNPSWNNLDSEECITLPNSYPTICVSNIKQTLCGNGVCESDEITTCPADCDKCSVNENCNDDNLCTTDTCEGSPKECKNIPVDCDDNNRCTIDSCKEGDCKHEQITSCSGGDICCPPGCTYETDSDCKLEPKDTCSRNSECKDDNPCTEDLCEGKPQKCINKQSDGCVLENKCLDHGTREKVSNAPSYCDLSNDWKPQKTDEAPCNDDYECSSNKCSESICIKPAEEPSVIEKIIDWLVTIIGLILGFIK